MVMKIYQHKLQSDDRNQTVNTVVGTERNVKVKGICFQTKVNKEKVEILVEFIKQLGIFEYRKDCGQNGLEIQLELGKIKDVARYEAVIPYLAGLFSNNNNIDFLTSCKNLCKNFLHLQENNSREDCIQDIFQSITESYDVGIGIMLSSKSGEELKLKSSCLPLLLEGMRAVEEKFKIEIDEITLDEIKKDLLSDLTNVVELMKKYTIAKVYIGKAECEDDLAYLQTLLQGIRTIEIDHLVLPNVNPFKAMLCNHRETLEYVVRLT